jgi:hypothetical protein
MSHTSPLSIAAALHEQHIDAWTPLTASHHGYWTRAEKKRVFAHLHERDMAFMSRYVKYSANSPTQIERVDAAIILFTYLTKANFLFRYAKIRDGVWYKMDEFEVSAHEMLEGINRIANWKEYEAQATLRNHLYELLHVMWHLREVLRGTNDETFKQDY